MSGPIVPPLEVTEVDGSPDGRPITKIIVSNGDLSISGRTATIDTTGSGGTPGGSDTEVQYNDGGAFGGDAGFVVSTAGGGATTRADLGNLRLGLGVVAQTLDHDIPISAGAAGQITLSNNNDGGGTMGDMQVNIIAQTATDDPILHLYNTGYSPGGKLHLDGGSGDFIITSGATSKDLDLKVNGTGQVEVQNTTTDTASVLSIMGNGTGDARLDMQNASKRVWVVCDENKKLKVQGGSGGDTFIFDVSSASGGITFPDSTTQTTAAAGVSFPLEAPDGSAVAPSYTFASQTGTGSYYHSTNKIGWATGGGLRMTLDNNHHLKEINRIVNDGGSWSYPSYTFDGDEDTGMGREDTNAIFFGTGGSARLTIGSDGTVDFINSKIEIDGDIGDDGQVLTSTGSAVAWEDAAGVSFPLEAPDGSVSAPSYSFSGETNTGLYRYGASELGVAVAGSLPITISSSSVWFQAGKRLRADAGSAASPSLSFLADGDTGIFSTGTNEIGFSTAGNERLAIGSAGEILVAGTAAGDDGQVLTSGGSGAAVAWEDAAGVSFPLEAPNGGLSAPSYSFSNSTDTGMWYATDFGNPVLMFQADGDTIVRMNKGGVVRFNEAYSFPTADGDADQVLTTDGAGALTFEDAAESLTLSTLQSEVAASSDFADFQSRIAAL